jgi:rSAM/selenodomain-associated transferase 1
VSIGTLVVVICKAPRKGHVKTRLAATVGDDAVYLMYSAMMAHVFSELARTNVEVLPVVDGPRELVQAGTIEPLAQRGDDLGERIINALVDAPVSERVLVIGTDMPFIDAELIATAESALDMADVVIGPSVDGGYYLIGMKSRHPEIFRDIDWSTERVFEQTMQRCSAKGLTVHTLDIQRDVDTIEDVKGLVAPDERHEHVVTILKELSQQARS